jgi:archaemetzincin
MNAVRQAILAILAICLTATLVGAVEPGDPSMLPAQFRRLLPLHAKLGSPQPGDWLTQHPESGQTFRQYIRANPIRATASRRVIYVQPLGDFTPTQKEIVDATTEFLGIYFSLPIKTREGLSLDLVPKSARRKPASFRSEQILTTYVLSDLLKPRLPKDAVAMIALTTSDLWPGEGWNYLFGQASLSDRVGIWSINRYGNPDTDADAYRRVLLRTLKTATHETGHMFSMAHCTLFECNMCGSNHLPEADRRPLELCPHCLAKLCYATGADAAKRFERLIAFYRAHGLTAEQAFCEKSLAAIKN